MDLLDYLPFIQFIRDDKETVNIMKEALKIVPRVCNILDLDTSAQAQAQPRPRRSALPAPAQAPPTPSTSSTSTRLGRTGSGSGNLKRTSGKKTDGSGAGAKKLGPAALIAGKRSASGSTSLVLPLKKRKISTATVKTETVTRENQSQARIGTLNEDAVKKLQEDYDKFIRQVGELAALEREKNSLLEKFLAVSSAMTGSENSTEATSNNPDDGAE